MSVITAAARQKIPRRCRWPQQRSVGTELQNIAGIRLFPHRISHEILGAEGREAAEASMPNRKTFNERDKYDHSTHSTVNPEKGDLAATPDAEPEATLPPDKYRVGSSGQSSPAGRSRRAPRRR
jgi:hypothetical protein